jgi:hypothetical protein
MPLVHAYTYDGPSHSARPSASNTERGPPATTYDHTALRSAVDMWLHGSSACPQPCSTWTYNDHDRPVRSVQTDSGSGSGITWTASGGSAGERRGVPGRRCAAKAASVEIDASKLTMTKTVEQHLTEYAKDGTLARPYGDFRLGKLYWPYSAKNSMALVSRPTVTSDGANTTAPADSDDENVTVLIELLPDVTTATLPGITGGPWPPRGLLRHQHSAARHRRRPFPTLRFERGLT